MRPGSVSPPKKVRLEAISKVPCATRELWFHVGEWKTVLVVTNLTHTEILMAMRHCTGFDTLWLVLAPLSLLPTTNEQYLFEVPAASY